MNGSASTIGCPNGHKSIDMVFCSVCGSPIGGPVLPVFDTPPTSSSSAPVPAPVPAGGPVPDPPPYPDPVSGPVSTPTTGSPRHLAPDPPGRGAGYMPDLYPDDDAPGSAAHHGPTSGPLSGSVPEVGAASDPHSGPVTGSVPRTGSMSGPVAGSASGPGAGSGRVVPAAGSGNPLGGPPPPARPQGGGVCPNCAAELEAGSRFCEVCGYDPTTGSLPQAPVVRPAVDPVRAPGPAPPPPHHQAPPAAGRLVAVIAADRAYYDSNHVSEVQFPLGVPPRSIELPVGPVSIGRRSRSRGTEPGIDLAGPPEDPAVSHTHASLLPTDDGSWELVDHGSTNGTYVNEAPQPVPANQPLPLAPGDRIYLGAWTRITLELRP